MAARGWGQSTASQSIHLFLRGLTLITSTPFTETERGGEDGAVKVVGGLVMCFVHC